MDGIVPSGVLGKDSQPLTIDHCPRLDNEPIPTQVTSAARRTLKIQLEVG